MIKKKSYDLMLEQLYLLKKKPTEQGFILRSLRYGIKQDKNSNTRNYVL
jgi:hypothetical protein